MSERGSNRFDELLSYYFLGELLEGEFAELSGLLRDDRARRDRFRLMAGIDADLRFSTSDSELDDGNDKVGIAPPARTWWWPFLVSATAASVLVLTGILWMLKTRSDANDGGVVSLDEQPIAVLAASHEAAFADGYSPRKDVFDAKEFRLLGGAVTMEFRSGVTVAVEGPSNFVVKNDMKMLLNKGKAWAVVDKLGKGFVIETPEMEIEDLGTEFGVLVEGNRSELHVFAGEVNVRRNHQPAELVRETYGLVWEKDLREEVSADYSAFKTSASIGYQRWLDHSKKLREDNSCLFYLDFEQDESGTLSNRCGSELGDPYFVSGIWATGRWPEKGSLLFERQGDRIELEVPGEHHQVTIMGWVLLHRIDEPLTTLFNTEGYEVGEHHWNLTRQGRFNVGIKEGFYNTFDHQVPLGQWTHVATVLNTDTRTAKYLINGQLVGVLPMKGVESVHFDQCSIGAWGETKGGKLKYIRELRGRIDEFCMFGRAFSETEIVNAYQSGCHF